MKTKADVAIIGCGEAGIFAGYELKKLHPELEIVVVEQGKDIYSRKCPIVAGKVKTCVHCKTCDTMCGFGGAGAFSDGKFNFTTQFGGWLTDYMEPAEVMELIEYVDSINVAHGATIERYSTSTPEARALEIEALKYDLHLPAWSGDTPPNQQGDTVWMQQAHALYWTAAIAVTLAAYYGVEKPIAKRLHGKKG